LFCLGEEDSFEDKIDDCVAADLDILKSSQFKYLPICWKYAEVVIEFHTDAAAVGRCNAKVIGQYGPVVLCDTSFQSDSQGNSVYLVHFN
jgi:hypothetical protein